MCVAFPGKVCSIEDNTALIDYDGNIIRAHTGIVDVTEGDSVLVHAGIVIQKLDEDEASKMTELFREIEGFEND